ncbi:MAG TPA: DUF4124 domain-containing protein [Rudaea sp.]|nr:DUF4124 domain-containing protein [Rudaea sp.]
MRTPWPTSTRLASQTGRVWPFFAIVLALIAGFGWWYLAPDTLPDAVRKLLPASERANPVLYKWRDAKGRWNVTDTPPADRPYETLKYDPKTNVVPTVMPPPLPADQH